MPTNPSTRTWAVMMSPESSEQTATRWTPLPGRQVGNQSLRTADPGHDLKTRVTRALSDGRIQRSQSTVRGAAAPAASAVERQTGALPAGGATSHAIHGGEPRSAEQARGGGAAASMGADDVDLCLGRERGCLLLEAAQWEVARPTRVSFAPLVGFADVDRSTRLCGIKSQVRPASAGNARHRKISVAGATCETLAPATRRRPISCTSRHRPDDSI
jgi:hypothetical protein